MSNHPRIAIAPWSDDALVRAVKGGGGLIVDPPEAEGIVWVDPRDPSGLKDLLEGAPARWVQLPFAGIEAFIAADVIDENRLWTCTKGAYGHSTAEHALALMLLACRRLHVHARDRKWVPAGLGSPERQLEGAVVVLIGTGGIGSALVAMLEPLRPEVIAVNRSGKPLGGVTRTVPSTRLDNVIGEADFVVLAASATPETHHMIDGARLAAMKDTAWLINVARGALVDHDALVEALRADAIGGAALDVTEPEPLPENHPLWSMDRVVITPHVANTWDMALPELRAVVQRNVARFAAGQPLEGVVDVALGY